MRNLRLFILKNYFFFLFLVFELISLTFLVSTNNYQKSTFMNSSNKTIGYLMEKKSDLTNYLYLQEINTQLAEENAMLKNLLKDSYYINDKGEISFKDSLGIVQYNYLPARVINNTVHLQDNYLTINRGSSNGIASGMGVCNDQSIVGIVKDVSEHYATVISVLNKNFVLSVKVKRTNDYGLIRWEGVNNKEVILSGITVDAPIEIGDTVVTRGNSPKFPENILVGIVKKLEMKPGSMHHHITVTLNTNFNSVYHVYVIDNKFKSEQEELENLLLEVPK